MQIKKVAVIGSGVMGAGIAAHLANAGIPSLLLDIVPKFGPEHEKLGLTADSSKFRNSLAQNSINNFILKSKPSLIFSKKDAKLITPGNMEDDLAKLGECDWIVEAVTERLEIKQIVFANVEKHMRKGAVVSSNTSGLPLQSMAEGRSEDFRKNFIVTHFFNPVRYMKLVEVVSSDETSSDTLNGMVDFLEHTLGKGVVYAKDTPNFIANRIGIFSWMHAFKTAIEMDLGVEEIDKIAGPAMGRPKTAAFRTADLVGIDTIVHVSQNTYDNCTNDEQRDVFAVPEQLKTIVEKGWLGNKTKGGFYKKSKNAEGKKEILSLDLNTLDYRAKKKVAFASLDAAKGQKGLGAKIKALLEGDDKAAQFAWEALSSTLVYAANRIPEIADDVVNIDNGMKWGFNWKQGPFETLDAIGVEYFAEKLKSNGKEVPQVIQDVLSKGTGSFYKAEGGKSFYFDIASGQYKEIETRPEHITIKQFKDQNKILKTNDSATLVDIGDGVLAVEFHTKMNAIDADIGQILNDALDTLESDNNYQGMVIANDAENFSAGANLMLLWLEAQQKNWDNIEKLVKGFQDVATRMRHFTKPIVAAPFGMTLGGGCEVTMACHKARVHGELYMGLVEVGAGLIPGGGGNLRLLLNIEAARKAKGAKGWAGLSDGGPFPKVQDAFQVIAFAKVSMSCKEAVGYNYLTRNDSITLSRDALIHDAKADVLEMAKNFEPIPVREDILVPGLGGKMALENAVGNFETQGLISAHDALIAKKLGHVLCAGHLPNQGYVTEQELLDIEREAFLSLCGEEKSQARMQSLLMTGKPLRN